MSIYQFPTQSSSSPYSSFPMSISGIQGQLLEVTGMLQILLLFSGFRSIFPQFRVLVIWVLIILVVQLLGATS